MEIVLIRLFRVNIYSCIQCEANIIAAYSETVM